MKRITLLTIALLFILTSSLKAQHDVNINVAGLLLKNYGLGYEYVINDEMGAAASFNFVNGGLFVDLTDDISYSSINFAPEFRFYTNPSDGGDGIFFAGYAKYQSSTWSFKDGIFTSSTGNSSLKDYDLNFSGVALGIQSGGKWVLNSGIFIESFFGVGRYLTTNWSSSDTDFDDQINDYEGLTWFSWDFRFSVAVGYRFGGY